MTLTARVKPANKTSPLTGSVSFTINSVSYGSANVALIPGDPDGRVEASVVVQESELPGAYSVTAVFASSNPNYSGNSGGTSLTVIPRNATPYNASGFYTGDLFAWTTSQNSSTGTLTMTAMIKDANTPGGDVRAAKVTFYLVNGTTLTPIGSAKNLPVGLIDVTDGSVGSASAIIQLDIGSQDAQSYQIAVGISGGYTNSPFDAWSGEILTVAKPLPGGFIVGGGSIVNTSASAGLIKGAVGQTTDFSFSVKYNKSLTNPQGKVVITLHSLYKPDGTLDSTLHTYVVTSNAISLLAVTVPAASFSSKANVSEQLSDGTLVGIDSGTVLQMSLHASTSATTDDTIGINVQRKAGGMWFSSKFDSATGKTLEQAKSGGDLSVN